MKNVFLFLCYGFFAILPLNGEENGQDLPRLAKGRVAWFVYTSIPEGLENPVTVMSGNDLVEVTLSKRSPSQPVPIPADGIVKIVRKVDNPSMPGKSTYLTLAQASIPEGMTKVLIILVPIAASPSGLLFQAKLQDLAVFKGGDCLYLNMTNMKVGVELGKTSMEIKPGETRISDLPKSSEPADIPIRYSYFNPEKQQWKMLSASTVAFYNTRRELCIFSWDPRLKRVNYHGITFPVTP